MVITDILLPRRDGIATILELRREAPTVAIIAISGDGNGMNYLNFAGKLGAEAVLSKPFKLAELIDVVNDLLSACPRRPLAGRLRGQSG
jgi:DNA-binding response OmpR family regulator